MGQELQIPDSFNVGPADAFKNFLDPTSESLADGIGQSYGVLGYRGKVWSIRYRGERHNIVRPDDGTPASYIDVVILGQAPQKSKSFYKKFDPSQSDGERPICSSLDGVVPDPDAQQKQAANCALCPRNVRKMNPETGRMGRECSDYKRLAVLVLPYMLKATMSEPLVEPIFLRVPAASLNSLAILGETMANRGYHFSSFITRITFDQDKSLPEMVFRPIKGLTNAEAPVIQELRNSDLLERITGVNTNRSSPAQPLPTQAQEVLPPRTASPAVTPTTSAPSQALNSQAASPPPSSSPTTASVQVAGQGGGAEASGPSSQMIPDDLGFGTAPPATPTPAPSSKPAVQTLADTGAPQEADSDLDARINSLLKMPIG